MAIYNKDGTEIHSAYNNAGTEIQNAYDINGNLVYTDGSVPLKIMTYNVGQWYIGSGVRVPIEKKAEYFNLQYNTFANNIVDVLFLQEYLNSWCDDDSSAQTDFIAPFFDDQEVANPQRTDACHSICTKNHEILNHVSHNFTMNSGNYPTFETAQIVVGDKTINIINTHNDYRLSPYQTQDITDLLDAVEQMEYFILCGDFNIDLSTQDTTSAQYQNSVKRFLDAGYNVGNCVVDWVPTYFGTSSPTGGKYTDQIVTSSNITIRNIYADTTKLTDGIGDKIDHLPLIAELIIH